MFYSEELLTKTGPLARVWLAANVERKLTKSQILQSDIPTSVGAIVNRGQEPMALRMSGQLMLGVVRIYGRKARYLLDDCNDALIKIRMTFKSTNNHDLPAHAAGTLDLNLPELLTIDDLFAPMDFDFPLTQQPQITNGDHDVDHDWTSSLNPQQSTSQSLLTPGEDSILNMDDDDLQLNFGDDAPLDFNDTTVSLQVGRNAPSVAPENPLDDNDGILDDNDDLNLNLGDDDVDGDVQMADDTLPHADDNVPAATVEGQDEPLAFGEDETLQLRNATAEDNAQPPRRASESPLSEAGSAALRELDETFQAQDLNDQDVTEIAIQQKQRVRKQKAIEPDVETVLHNKQIKAQAEDRSKILKPPSFLPRDPFLLTLMSMQKNGDFVSRAMNDGRSMNWAPELQGLLSFESVRASGDRKRKRDSGIGGLSEDEHSEKSPRLERDHLDQEDEAIALPSPPPQDPSLLGVEPIPTEPGLEDIVQGEDDEGIFGGGGDDDNTFDDTTMPLVHPADSGPISLGTKHAVHLLREHLGDSASQESPSSQARKSVLLQDLVPEGRTSKEDATKMFFEVLVLATKDAIKVEQSEKAIGLPLRIRAKRGLWGSWAEEAPGEDPTLEKAPRVVEVA